MRNISNDAIILYRIIESQFAIINKMSNSRGYIIRIQLLFLAIVLSQINVTAQQSEDVKNIFNKAESYYIYEEYELANQLYLLIESPDNMNIKYKIGTCYLNIPGEKEKSMPYLEAAVKNSSYDSKTESIKETKAPLDAYFSLAKAYMINNDFDKALNTLYTFDRLAKETGNKEQMANYGFINQQIQACKNAIQYRKVPVLFSKETLGKEFALGSINENPAVSFDGKTIVYTERRGIENAIFFSRKTNGKWEAPIEITSELKAGTDCSSCSLNNDGTELFLYKTDNYDGAIYSSDFVNGSWTPIKKLNKNINTKYYEAHASISADGKKLYFSSNREGGYGNLDIYVSEKDATGNWGPAVNLGREINTPFNEDTPFITKNDSLLFFCSEGHNSMGGFDIFKSQRNGNSWKTPSNLGYPINSADDDKFLQPFNNGKNAFYSITTDYKKKEIFYLDLENSNANLPYKITGKMLLNDTIAANRKNNKIRIINKVTNDTLYKGSSDQATGSYGISVGSGFFKILYTSYGYLPQSVDTMITVNSPEHAINIDVTLLRDTSALRPPETIKYERIDLAKIPTVAHIDSSILIKNMHVNDESDKNINDSDVLYYTVQVIALHKPVDVSYFKYIHDMKVMYNDNDKFYRYTTGIFQVKDDAYKLRLELIRKGYPEEIFIKKVSK
jgi:hypothetical protein